MADARDAFPLLRRQCGEQCTRSGKHHPLPAACTHPVQHIPAQHSRRAAAPGAAHVDILFFGIVNHHAAVLISFAQIDAVGQEQIPDDVAAQLCEVAG